MPARLYTIALRAMGPGEVATWLWFQSFDPDLGSVMHSDLAVAYPGPFRLWKAGGPGSMAEGRTVTHKLEKRTDAMPMVENLPA